MGGGAAARRRGRRRDLAGNHRRLIADTEVVAEIFDRDGRDDIVVGLGLRARGQADQVGVGRTFALDRRAMRDGFKSHWGRVVEITKSVLGIPDEEIVVCGMALGHEDTSKPESTFRTGRAPLEEWVTFSR